MEETRRRRFLLAALAALAPFRASGAEPSAPYRVTIFGRYSPQDLATFRPIWLQHFAEQGFIEGRDLRLTIVDVGFRSDQELEPVAREIVASRPSVIITFGTRWTGIVKRLTADIPIVFLRVADPVGAGLVETLARPGGNLTGLTNRHYDLEAKRLELLREVNPKARRVAVVCEDWFIAWRSTELHAAAARLGLTVAEVTFPEGTPAAAVAQGIRRAKAEGALYDLDATHPGVVPELSRLRIPIVYNENRVVEAGGLMSLGERIPGPSKRAVAITVRILRGEKPATIPVDQLSIFHLALNLRAAREIGLAMPESIRLRADQVIE